MVRGSGIDDSTSSFWGGLRGREECWKEEHREVEWTKRVHAELHINSLCSFLIYRTREDSAKNMVGKST